MTKYVFNKPQKSDIMYLDDSGELVTEHMNACIKYEINRYDYDVGIKDDVNITIDNQCFEPADIDDLIEFLHALKEEISK